MVKNFESFDEKLTNLNILNKAIHARDTRINIMQANVDTFDFFS